MEVSTAEAAEMLGCSRDHVSDLVRMGKLKGRRLSRQLMLVDKRSVDAYARKTFTRGWKRGRPRKPTEAAPVEDAPPSQEPRA